MEKDSHILQKRIKKVTKAQIDELDKMNKMDGSVLQLDKFL